MIALAIYLTFALALIGFLLQRVGYDRGKHVQQ